VDLLDEVTHWRGRRLLLKMDVEGAEEHILPRVIDCLPSQCAIFFEVHGGQGVWNKLGKIASQNGFHVEITRQRDCFIDVFAARDLNQN
jgi:hypothetical protein